MISRAISRDLMAIVQCVVSFRNRLRRYKQLTDTEHHLMNYKITEAVENTCRSICYVKKSFKLIYGAKLFQNNAGDLSRASLHQSKTWIFVREDLRTVDNQAYC